ncbi:MAG: sulfatase [Candidatus Hodarchaeota archaeon]
MSERMNVLVIITDQQRADHLSCMGNSLLKTPNIDRIAKDGVKFTNYYCASPLYMPNRGSFFTGCHPSTHGTRSNGINLDPSLPMISDILRRDGYRTVSVGKTHFNFFSLSNRRGKSLEDIVGWLHGDVKSSNFPSPWYGFEDVFMTAGHGDFMAGHYSEWLAEKGWDQHTYAINRPLALNENYFDTEMPEELYPTSYISEKTSEFLESHVSGDNADKPFFLHCSYPDPHHPVCPPGKYRDMYKPEDIELPPNYDDGENLLDHEFLGPHIKDARFRMLLPQRVSREEVKKFLAYTFGSIAMIDDGVGRIVGTLKKTDLYENTMVIFTSDHGDLGGEHGLILKGPAHYRGLINMPLLWKIPGVTKTSVTSSLVSTIDIPSTLLQILGVKKRKIPVNFQGIDFSPIFNDPSYAIRNQILIEHDEEISKDKTFRLRTLVTENHRLTIYDGYDNFGELFDLKKDPTEINNLWAPEAELRNELQERLLREIVKMQPRMPERTTYN